MDEDEDEIILFEPSKLNKVGPLYIYIHHSSSLRTQHNPHHLGVHYLQVERNRLVDLRAQLYSPHLSNHLIHVKGSSLDRRLEMMAFLSFQRAPVNQHVTVEE